MAPSSDTATRPPVRRPLIVIPAWNEQDALPGTLRELRAHLPELDILVVDDGSLDATAQLAREAGARVASVPFNLGVGGAMRVGFKYALRHGHDAVVQFDADGQHRPEYIADLLSVLSEADLVVGNRFSDPQGYDARGPRRWAMVMLSWVISRLAGRAIHDTTSGFRATGAALIPLYAQCYPAEYLGDTIEALVIAIRSGYRVEQLPVAMRPRQAGAPSQSTPRMTLYLMRALLVLGLSLIRRWPTGAGSPDRGPVGSAGLPESSPADQPRATAPPRQRVGS
jgi:hypothetical protein